MKCPNCQNEWEGEGLCPSCANLTQTPHETAHETAQDVQAPIPLPIFSEGFAEGQAQGAAKKRAVPTGLVILFTAIITLTAVVGAFLGAAALSPKTDVFNIFHPADELDIDSEAIMTVLNKSFQATFRDYDFNAYLDLFAPKARDSYSSTMATDGGYQSVDEMVADLSETQSKQYASFTFSELEPLHFNAYTREGIQRFLEADYSSALFGSPYTSADLDALVNAVVTFDYTNDEVKEPTAGSLSFLLVKIDGAWYLI